MNFIHVLTVLLSLILSVGLLGLIARRTHAPMPARVPVALPIFNARLRGRRGRQQGGFTLIELLVVIFILAAFACAIAGLIALVVYVRTHS